MVLCVNWPLLLSDFNKLEFSRQVSKNTLSNFMTIQPVGAEQYHADGQTWHRFSDFEDAPINSAFCPHCALMCFVWIWEQTAIISLYSINWLVFITDTECVYCAIRTGSLCIILRSAHTVYLCVLCGSENKQRLFPYTALTDWFL